MVVTAYLDRVARDTAALLDTVRGFSRQGVALHSVADGGLVEVVTSNGLLTNGVKALLAEHYRALIAEKTRAALALRRRQRRRYSHVPPFGYAVGADGQLAIDPVEQQVVARIQELVASGVSLRRLAGANGELARLGIRQRNGRPWSLSLLWRVVHRSPVPLSVNTIRDSTTAA